MTTPQAPHFGAYQMRCTSKISYIRFSVLWLSFEWAQFRELQNHPQIMPHKVHLKDNRRDEKTAINSSQFPLRITPSCSIKAKLKCISHSSIIMLRINWMQWKSTVHRNRTKSDVDITVDSQKKRMINEAPQSMTWIGKHCIENLLILHPNPLFIVESKNRKSVYPDCPPLDDSEHLMPLETTKCQLNAMIQVWNEQRSIIAWNEQRSIILFALFR